MVKKSSGGSFLGILTILKSFRITNISKWHFERVVFPGECLLFEALPEAQLEIHTGTVASAILLDRILCAHLRINEGMEDW